MSNNADKQAVEFFIKRAKLAEDMADHHCKDYEFSKGLKLYQQAYSFYKKAEQNLPDDESIKQKVNEVRVKYQKTKKLAEEQANKNQI